MSQFKECKRPNEKIQVGDRICIQLRPRLAYNDKTSDGDGDGDGDADGDVEYKNLPLELRHELADFMLNSQEFYGYALEYSTQDISNSDNTECNQYRNENRWNIDLPRAHIDWDPVEGIWTLNSYFVRAMSTRELIGALCDKKDPVYYPKDVTVGNVIDYVVDGFFKATHAGDLPSWETYKKYLGSGSGRYQIHLDGINRLDVSVCVYSST